jgi:hypothetical protein
MLSPETPTSACCVERSGSAARFSMETAPARELIGRHPYARVFHGHRQPHLLP